MPRKKPMDAARKTILTLMLVATVYSVQCLALPPHDGWVLERTFGSLDPQSPIQLYPCVPNAVALRPALGVNAAGEVFFTSSANLTAVHQFNSVGVFVRTIQGNVGTITGMATRGDSTLYMVGLSAAGIGVYNLSTSQLTLLNLPAPAGSNKSIVISESGNIFVSDGTTVYKYGASDVYEESWGVIPELGDFARPQRLATTASGNVLVGNQGTGRILQFSPQGQLLKTLIQLESANEFYDSLTSRFGSVYAFPGFYDSFGQFADFVPGGFLMRATFGADGSLYGCRQAPGSNYYLIYKYRPGYRTADTLIGAGRIPFPEVRLVVPRPGTTIVDVDFIIHDADSPTSNTAVIALLGGTYSFGSARKMTSIIEGTASNLGAGVQTGVVKRITWDAGADLSGGGSIAQAKIMVLANDGRGIVDIHYVTIPSNVPNSGDPVLIISDTPVTESEMLNAWMWLVARDDSELAISGSNVVKVGGANAGTIFVAGTATTVAGRAFLLDRLGVHEASAAEVLRAKTGTTPGIQQYEPLKRVGPRPIKINEIGFDTGSTSGFWVVPN